jgi:hypothetical protein
MGTAQHTHIQAPMCGNNPSHSQTPGKDRGIFRHGTTFEKGTSLSTEIKHSPWYKGSFFVQVKFKRKSNEMSTVIYDVEDYGLTLDLWRAAPLQECV